MGNARQTVERRTLGLALRRLRDQAGVSQAESARHIGRSDSRISKVEDGVATLAPDELARLIDFLGAGGEERDNLLALGIAARKRQPKGSVTKRGTYTDTLPGSFQRMADMEDDAATIFWYEPGVIPGPLQAPRYVRALMRAGDGIWWQEFGPDADSRVSFRLERQKKLLASGRPKGLQFVLTEEALYDDGLHSDVMREQYEHLLALTTKHPNLDVRVLKVCALDNPAPSGGIIVFDFDRAAPDIGFTPVVRGPSTYFGDEEDTAALLNAFRRVQGLALSSKKSVELIRRKAREA